MRKSLRGVLVSGMLAGALFSVFVSSGVVHAAGAATPPHVAAQPTSTIVIRSAPDAEGGVWVHTETVWRTAYPLTKPNAAGHVFAAGAVADAYSGGGSCTPGYVTKDNQWGYSIGPLWFLQIDVWTQDKFNCVNDVTNEYIDPQCVANNGSQCLGTTQGVFHNVNCDTSPTFGTCNKDWVNINTYNGWNGANRTQYLRTWVDFAGNYGFHDNVG